MERVGANHSVPPPSERRRDVPCRSTGRRNRMQPTAAGNRRGSNAARARPLLGSTVAAKRSRRPLCQSRDRARAKPGRGAAQGGRKTAWEDVADLVGPAHAFRGSRARPSVPSVGDATTCHPGLWRAVARRRLAAPRGRRHGPACDASPRRPTTCSRGVADPRRRPLGRQRARRPSRTRQWAAKPGPHRRSAALRRGLGHQPPRPRATATRPGGSALRPHRAATLRDTRASSGEAIAYRTLGVSLRERSPTRRSRYAGADVRKT
jgi:hypothetical protein